MPIDRSTALAATLSALLASTAAGAQTPPAPPAAPEATPSPARAPARVEPGVVAVVAGVPIRLTGIVHATVIASQPVQSFGYATAVAPTSAMNPLLTAEPDAAELTFQVQQTRLGIVVGDGAAFRAQVEVDFTHFDQSSPTTQAFPRLRIASLEWRPSPTQRLFIGQTWDLFGNATGPQLLSHSFNLVGTLFQAGNIGFMRHQLGWSGRFGAVELSAALGLQGANTGPTFSSVESSFTPTGSARVMVHLGAHGAAGVSALGTAIRFTSGAQEERSLALGGVAFADLTFGRVNLHAEAYVAQNLANLGALDLAMGRFGTDVADAGGYLSARIALGRHALTAMAGVAAVLAPSAVAPGYAPPTGTGLAVASPPAGPGITRNVSAHLGWWYSPLPGLSIVLEPYLYATRFALAPADAARVDADRLAAGAMLGAMFQI